MKKKLVAGLASSALVVSALTPAAFAANFSDVQGTQYQAAVNLLKALNVVNGDTNGNYNPYNTITRAEFAKIAIEAAGLDAAAQAAGNGAVTGFNDVDGTGYGWAAGYIKVARDHGIVKGVDQWNFQPGDNVKYEDVITVLERLLGYSDASVGGYYNGYVAKAQALGLLKGTGFAIGSPANRGDVAVLTANTLSQNVVGASKSLLATNFSSIPGTTSVSGAVYAASANTITVGNSVYNVTGDSDIAGGASLASLVGHNVNVSVDANGNVVLLQDAGSAASSVAKVSISGNNSVAVGQSEKLVAVAQDANGNAVSLPGSVSAVWSISGSGAQVDANGNFIASTAGTYTVTATINGVSSTANVVVYGVAAGVKLSGPANIVANSVYKATLTATVVDTNGNPVLNFNGTANLTDSPQNGTAAVTLPAPATVTFSNGVGTFKVQSANNTANLTDIIAVNTLASNNGQAVAQNPTYGTLSISTVSSNPTALTLKPSTSTLSANNGGTPVSVAVGINDGSGTAIVGGASQYVTFTITGPGSFTPVGVGQTPQTSLTQYTNGSNINVYPVQGQTGAITVTATASGLTSATSTINAVVTGAPASVKLTTGQTSTLQSTWNGYPSGTSFTEYTAQLVDANGNAVAPTSADVFTISDNSNDNGHTQYYSVDTTQTPDQPTGSAWSYNSSEQYTQAVPANGQLKFIVMNKKVNSTPGTITVADQLTGQSSTAQFNYVVGPAARVNWNVQNSTSAGVDQQPGTTVQYSVQLKDVGGNNSIAQAGVPVQIWFDSNASVATINGSSSWTSGSPLVLTTDSNGKAYVNVTVPSGATNALNGFTLKAQLQTGQIDSVQYLTANVTTAASYTQSLNLVNLVPGTGAIAFGNTVPTSNQYNWPTASQTALNGNTNPAPTATTIGAPVNLGAVYIASENTLGQVISSSDQLDIKTSNSNVVNIGPKGTTATGWSDASDTTDYRGNGVDKEVKAVASAVGYVLPTFYANQAGTATITITDLSQPSVPAITYTINVVPGAALATPAVLSGGNVVVANKKLSVTANTPVAVQITNVDGSGNPVPVAGTNNLVVGLNDSYTAGGNGGFYTSTPGGAPINTVTIPAGQQSATVYYVNAVSGSYDLSGSVSDVGQTLTALAPNIAQAGVNAAYTLTFANSNYNGTLPISVVGALNGANGKAATLPTTATFVNGTATVNVQFASLSAQALTFTVNGVSATAASVTPTVGPLASASASYATNSASIAAAGSTSAATLTGKDAYGDAVVPAGGTFTIANASGAPATQNADGKVTINANTGVVSVAAGAAGADAGSYTVTYTQVVNGSNVTATATVTIGN